MSLLSPNWLEIVLYPDRVVLIHTKRKLTLHGYRKVILLHKIIPCQAVTDDELPWHSAIRTLETALSMFVNLKPEVNVSLSNHFMQYLLVPWFDKMSDEEDRVLARHSFKEIFGEAADRWDVLTSPGIAGVPTLASAVDERLLEELRGLLQRLGLAVKSIRPHLMVAINSCQPILKWRSAWLALLEPGCLCLAVLKEGQVVWIRKLRIGNAWREELSPILQREAYLADTGVEMNEVFLWAPQLEGLDMPNMGWQKFEHFKQVGKPDHGLGHVAAQTLAAAPRGA